jgi:hypothetical protein
MIPRLPLMRSGLSTPLSLSKRSIATFVEVRSLPFLFFLVLVPSADQSLGFSHLNNGQPPTRITTLPNRIRVATNDAPAHVQSITLMLAAAARYETDDTQGFGYLLTKLAMKVSRSPCYPEKQVALTDSTASFVSSSLPTLPPAVNPQPNPLRLCPRNSTQHLLHLLPRRPGRNALPSCLPLPKHRPRFLPPDRHRPPPLTHPS